MFEYIFTIGCFDKLHKGHIKLLESIKKQAEKIIIGLHDNNSIEKIKNISDIDCYDNRKKNLEKYAHDIFMINDVDPTKSIQEYISKHFNKNLLSINIGPSQSNSKVIKNDYTEDLFFIHQYIDTFEYYCKDNNITVTRTDKNCGWGQNLIAYKKNWCFMIGDDNKNFCAIEYVKSIMPIQYLSYLVEISETTLIDYKNDKVSSMNYLLQKVVSILDENNIPYYLDCGTLLGCIRENGLMKKDTDIDISIHLSYWDKLNAIIFDNYHLTRTRTINCKKNGYIISVKFPSWNMYCDIYANPAFPQLEIANMNNKNYFIPKNSDLYLTQLYGNWKIPSGKHADWPKLFYDELIYSPYSKYWDLDYEIKLDPLPMINKKNLNKIFWDNYYKSTNDDIIKQSSFAEFVYENYCKDCEHILDLGSGNCRDSIFFSKKNIQVDAVDYNGHIDNNYPNLTLIKKDVELFLSDKDVKPHNLVYMRWFLHAMPFEKAENIFKLCSNILDKGQKICIEVRSINDNVLINNSIYDKEDSSYRTTHKRWLYSIAKLENLITKYNMKKIYIKEGYFSPNKNTETDNPLIIRCITERI
jgi:tellurite methyltransferase